MNPLTERRQARRRRIAEWAARMERVMRAQPAEGQFDSQPAGPSLPPTVAGGSQARRLPFELVDGLEEPQAAGQPSGPAGSTLASPETGSLEPGEGPRAERPGSPAASAESDQFEILRRAARDAAERGEWARALSLNREILAADPGDVGARNNLALALEAMGEHEAALEELNRCLALAPESLDLLINRSAVLGSLRHYADAERDLAAVLGRDPANADAHFNLGVVASRRGRWREAVQHLRRAVELDGGRAATHFYLGEALNKVDDLPGALQAYQRAVELQPTHARAWYGMGIVLDRMNRPDEAAPLYRRSRELSGR
jgi:tetratricopeptide (TPR) repeat protein